jgi:hypothetical protein
LIGNYLSGKSMRAEIKDPAYSWLTPYMEDGGLDLDAALLALSIVIPAKSRKHETCSN